MVKPEGKIAVAVLNNSTREYDREYDYIIPEALAGLVVPGIRAAVPFGKSDSLRQAFILNIKNESDTENLKEIKRVLDSEPVLDEDMLELGEWMKRRYICTYADAFKCMIPAGIGLKSTKIVVSTGKSDDKTSDPQKALLDILSESGGECDADELKKRSGIRNTMSLLIKMQKSGIVDIRDEYSTRVSEKTLRVAFLAKPQGEIAELIDGNLIKSIQQIRVLEILMENAYISTADLTRFAGVSAGVLNTLVKYGHIAFDEVEVMRSPYTNKTVTPTVPYIPTPEQKSVLDALREHLDSGKYAETLLHGITGSGKTEIYLQLAEQLVKKGKQAIVLVPEISLTPQMIERFRARFGKRIAVMHSRLSLGERYDQWRLIRNDQVDVVVGVRSAVFAPLKRLGAIIVDEEHESTYKSEITPKYDAREIARQRCRQHGALLLLGTATPSVVTYHKALKNKSNLYYIGKRPNNIVLPDIKVIDMREELEAGNRSILSKTLSDEIAKNLGSKQQTILLLNRRGHSNFVLCRNCGYAVKCRNCNITMTYHSSADRLICHYCGYTFKMPHACPNCGSSNIKFFGTGTQKVEEEIKKVFPGASMLRMDMDTTTAKNSHEEILSKFEQENIDILIGTQMIAKGLDFPNVTLVGMLAADGILNLEDYRATERTFQLITQVSGRAGRGDLPGRVVIQTYNTDAYSIKDACNHDYNGFYKKEIQLREQMIYPPFTHIATAVLTGTNDANVQKKAFEVREMMSKYMKTHEGNYYINGPGRAPVSKIKGDYRWRFILKCGSLAQMISLLTAVSDRFNTGYKRTGIRLSVDIDPVSML